MNRKLIDPGIKNVVIGMYLAPGIALYRRNVGGGCVYTRIRIDRSYAPGRQVVNVRSYSAICRVSTRCALLARARPAYNNPAIHHTLDQYDDSNHSHRIRHSMRAHSVNSLRRAGQQPVSIIAIDLRDLLNLMEDATRNNRKKLFRVA